MTGQKGMRQGRSSLEELRRSDAIMTQYTNDIEKGKGREQGVKKNTHKEECNGMYGDDDG